MQTDLPETYYLDNVLTLFAHVRRVYADILDPEPLQFLERFDMLSADASKLCIRLLNRSHDCYRISKLHYNEIVSLQTAISELAQSGFIELNANIDRPDLLSLYTLTELRKLMSDYPALSVHGKLRRSELESALIESAETEESKEVWMFGLYALEEKHLELLNQITQHSSEDEKENEAHLLEQLYDCRQMREDFEAMLIKHNGHSSRVIGNVLQEHGVDEQIYHKGAVIGNHCMAFAENGHDILQGVSKDMKTVINTPLHIQYLDNLTEALDGIMDPLYNVDEGENPHGPMRSVVYLY